MMLDGQQDLYADLYIFPAAWNPLPVTYTHTRTSRGLSQSACSDRRGEPSDTGEEEARRCRSRQRLRQKAVACWAVRAAAGAAPNYPRCPQPAGSPRGNRRSGFQGNGAIPKQRIPFSSLRWLKYPFTFSGGVNNKRERQQINETSRILSPAKCLFSSVFPRARGSPAKLEQRDFKFGKNLGNRSS